jgi:hypothetical protein
MRRVDLVISTLAARPDLEPKLWELDDEWPTFMLHDRVADLYFDDVDTYRTRADGLPHDPWLRVHARAGAEVVAVAPTSMTVAGSLAEWRQWTGLAFDSTGDVEVPGALLPVRCEPQHDFAVYVEPNVWMHHRLS